VNDMDVELPTASKRAKDPKPKVQYVTVESSGRMYLNREQVDLAGLREKLIAMRVDDPDLNVTVRGDGHTKYRNIVAVMHMMQQANIGKVNRATEPFPDGKGKD